MPRRPKLILLVLAGLAVAGAIASAFWIRTVRASAAPVQPLGFPHRAHTQNQIDCSFCHAHVEQNHKAGIPRVSLCASCHSGMPQESADAQALARYADEGREIPWVRLYQLPDYNFFSHKWHVRAGVTCAECHGSIGESVSPVRHMQYKMAWCIDCHTRRGASIDCLTCHR